MATVVEKMSKRLSENPNIRTFNFDWPMNDAVTTRLRDVLETSVDEKYYLSEEKTAKLIAQLTEKGMRVDDATIDMKSETSKTRGGMFKDGCVGALDHNCNVAVTELQQYTDGSGISYTIDANYTKGTSPGDIGKGRRTHVIEGAKPRYRIRKLTPRECWRLQGFADTAHDKVAAAGISDSQRYKQAGNAVTVNVISAIGDSLVKRLIPLLNENITEVAL